MPVAKLDTRFSAPDASALDWEEGRKLLEEAEIFWISTVRADGRPHVTPVIAVWLDDALHFCTGADEQKARNLEKNKHCILTTGRNIYSEGVDVVVEGDAEQVSDDERLQRLADAYVSKYGEEWRFEVREGLFHHDEGSALVFAVAPRKALGFDRGEPGGQTSWRFDGS